MRRALSLTLIGLGVFCISAGLLLRFYAYPELAKIPQDPKTESVAQGSGVTALLYVEKNGPGKPATPEVRQNLSLTATTRVTGDLSAPESKRDGNVVTWTEASRVTVDDDDPKPDMVVNASVRQLCLDRFTAEAVAPCTNSYLEKEQGKRATPASPDAPQFPGLNFKFPFGTQKQTYKWFDLSLNKTIDAKFDGEDEISGVAVYKFRQTSPATQIDFRKVPGSLIGKPDQPTVEAGLFYEVDRTLWIEPETGAVIKARQWSKQELRTPEEGPGRGTTVFDGTMELNAKTVANNVRVANENMGKLWLLTGLPVILWIVGGVLLVAGIVLLLTGRSRAKHTF